MSLRYLNEQSIAESSGHIKPASYMSLILKAPGLVCWMYERHLLDTPAWCASHSRDLECAYADFDAVTGNVVEASRLAFCAIFLPGRFGCK